MSEDSPLSGHTILVTRPAHQASPLCQEIEKAGGEVVRCPAIEILPPRNDVQAKNQLKQLNGFDIAIFVSVNAVESALMLLAPAKLPNKLRLAAIGISTASSLRSRGYRDIIHPQTQFNSEGLLETAALKNVAGKNIALIRGETGREWLESKLKKNGALVTRIVAYRRKRPVDSKKILRQALQNNQISIITVTSNEGLENITKMAGELRNALQRLPVVVLSDRNRQHAIELGYRGPIEIAKQASHQSIAEAVVKLASAERCRGNNFCYKASCIDE